MNEKTLRDEIAIAMLVEFIRLAPRDLRFGIGQEETNAMYSESVYALADAMLAARSKSHE